LPGVARIRIRRRSLSHLRHQPAQGRPLEGGEPGDDDRSEEVVEQPPELEKFGPIDGNQGKCHPVAKTITTGYEFSQERILLLHPPRNGLDIFVSATVNEIEAVTRER
jgi:hypothetical protein